MTPQIRSQALAAMALAGAVTLAACGGSSSDSGAKASADPAASRAAAEKLIAQAIAPNPKADSGRIDARVDVKIKGLPRFAGTTSVTADGVYDLPDGAAVPDLDVDVGLLLNDEGLGGALVVADGTGFIKLGNTGYQLPDSISQKLQEPAPEAQNGLTKTAAMFYINPQTWQKDAQLVGEKKLAGESVQEIRAEIQPDRFFADIARLTNLLTRLRITQAVGLPTALGPKVRAALVRSTTLAKGEVWIGTTDHVLRKAHLVGKIVVSSKDRKVLGGITSATLDAVVNVTDVGSPQNIDAPSERGSYSALQLSLSALGESVRNKLRGR